MRCQRQTKTRLAGWAAALGLLLAAGPAAAQIVVYHSPNDDGVNPGTAYELSVGPWESLYVWIDAGGTASQTGTVPCSDGDGRELCGWEILVKAVGSANFVDFIPSSGVVHRLTSTELEANGLLALNPALGPVRVGELKVSSSEPGGDVMLEAGQAVLSALQVEEMPQTVMATTPAPEPAGWLQLVAGGLLLAGLSRRRSLAGRARGLR